MSFNIQNSSRLGITSENFIIRLSKIYVLEDTVKYEFRFKKFPGNVPKPFYKIFFLKN